MLAGGSSPPEPLGWCYGPAIEFADDEICFAVLAHLRRFATFAAEFSLLHAHRIELLSKVKELGDVSKSDLVRSTGYVSTKKDGTERLNFTAFYEALLEAKGVSLGDGVGKGKGKGGRTLSYVATVQGNGNLLVGKAYTALLGLEPGDEFEIKLGRKQIRLLPAGAADEEE